MPPFAEEAPGTRGQSEAPLPPVWGTLLAPFGFDSKTGPAVQERGPVMPHAQK